MHLDIQIGCQFDSQILPALIAFVETFQWNKSIYVFGNRHN